MDHELYLLLIEINENIKKVIQMLEEEYDELQEDDREEEPREKTGKV